MPKFKIYSKVCHRCNQPYETDSKLSKICHSCKGVKGMLEKFRIDLLREIREIIKDIKDDNKNTN